MNRIGREFQQQTKYRPDNLPAGFLNYNRQPEIYKEYKQSPKIDLPPFARGDTMPLDQILSRRRSVRLFTANPLSLKDLSFLLWAADGVSRRTAGFEFRTAPSAGALYPRETYLVVNNVKDVEQGVYHYAVRTHQLAQLKCGDFRTAIARAALGQTMCASAAVVIIWTAVFYRSAWKYQQRAYRYVYLDAGHIGQNLALAATCLGLGSCQIAALFDDEVNEILQVDGQKESVLYMSVIGHPRTRTWDYPVDTSPPVR